MATNTFKSNVAANIVTSGNTVYTVPAATQTTLIGLTLCNKSTSTVTATVSLTRSAVNAKPSGASGDTQLNMASANKPVKEEEEVDEDVQTIDEDISNIFSGEENLSEEFKQRVATIF